MILRMTEVRWGENIPIDEHAALCVAADESRSPLLQALIDGTTLEKLTLAVERLYARWPERLAEDVDELLDAYGRRGRILD
jgi:hypothetical protein